MKLSYQYTVLRVASASEKVPPEPGTTPIPPDHVRLYHYTGSRNQDATEEQLAENLRTKGIDIGQAKGSTYGEPNAVWASTKAPGKHKVFAEFDIHKDDPRWDIGRPRTPQDVDWLNNGNIDVTFKGSIRPEEIHAIHMPWHHPYRYLIESDMIPNVLAGEYDFLLEDYSRHPAESKAIEYIKNQYGENQEKAS
jgi:hypothetical protein